MSKKNGDRFPICEHPVYFPTDPDRRWVTSLSDGEEWVKGMPLRVTVTCSDKACVLDAMSWVLRGEGIDRVFVYDQVGQEVTI